VSSTINCDLVSFDGVIFSGPVKMVVVRSSLGDLGITFGHTPLLADLVAGKLRLITPNVSNLEFNISGGFIEVQPNMVKILADVVEKKHE